MSRLAALAAMVAAFMTLLVTLRVTPAPGHPGGFYADVVATGYGVEILSVDGNSHVSPDKLSAITKLVGDTRDLYMVNYTLKTKGMNVITVSAPPGVEVGFKAKPYWKSEVVFSSDVTDPPIYSRVAFNCTEGISSWDNESYAYNFKVWATSNGEYGKTTPNWIHGTSSLPNNTTSWAKKTFIPIDNGNYVGWNINVSTYLNYTNTSSSHIHEAIAWVNLTVLVNKNGKEVIVNVTEYAYAYRSGKPSKSAAVNMTIIVNTSGWWLFNRTTGNLVDNGPETSVSIKSGGTIDADTYFKKYVTVDGNDWTQAWAEFENVYINVTSNDGPNIKHVKPGLWAFTNSDTIDLTMYIYPHPIASGYKQIFVQFTRQ